MPIIRPNFGRFKKSKFFNKYTHYDGYHITLKKNMTVKSNIINNYASYSPKYVVRIKNISITDDFERIDCKPIHPYHG
jgi:hypothetical protein